MSISRRKIIDLPLLQQFATDGVGPLVSGLSSVTTRVSAVEAKFPENTIHTYIYSDGWAEDVYSFENDYPKDDYDIDIYLDDSIAERNQRDVFVDCTPAAASDSNAIVALDGAPAINIPIVLVITATQGNGLRVHMPSGGSRATGVPVMTGATATRNGRTGTVPAPMAGDQYKVFLGSGEFGAPVVSDIYDICGDGSGAMVTINAIINTIVNKLQARTVWKSFSESSGGGESGGGGSSVIPAGTVTVTDTYNVVGLGAGETVTVQQLFDAIINRVDSRTTWSSFNTPTSETESETSSDEPEAQDENSGGSEADPVDNSEESELLQQIQDSDPGTDSESDGAGE